MRGLIPNCNHSYTSFFFFFVVLALFRHVFSINTLSSTETLTISGNRSIVSPGDVFELGFFKTTTTSVDGDRWYLGIWYKSMSKRTYVWVANRDDPLYNSTGTFKISDANLILLDQSNSLVWSTNHKKAVKSHVVAELLANGKFVLRDSKTKDSNRFLWQSFDFPVDTFLPEMKIGQDLNTGHDKFLSSWKNPNDPSTGDFSLKLETQGLHEVSHWQRDFKLYRTGPWNGIWFNGIPKMEDWSYVVNSFIENKEEVAYTYKVTNRSIHSRFRLSSDGLLQWIPTIEEQTTTWILPQDECDVYVRCGPYSYCDTYTSPVCNCISGFEPKNMAEWASGETLNGCVRKSPLSCGSGDGFLLLTRMKLPETRTVVVDKTMGFKECMQSCRNDCNCTGFASMNIQNGGPGCVFWSGELVDMRSYVDWGQKFYIKIDVSSASTIRHGSYIRKYQGIGISYVVMWICLWFLDINIH